MIVFIYAVFIFLILRFCVTLFNFLSNPKLGYYGKHFNDKVSIIVLSPNGQVNIENLQNAIDEQEYRNIEVLIQQNETIAALTKRATGRYFLFINPDATIHHGAINNLIYRVKVFDLAVLSLIPTYTAHGFWANCIYPLNDFLLLNLLPLRLVRLTSIPAFSAGSNDCLFFDATHYKRLSWTEELVHKLPSAMEIVKLVKQDQFNAEVLLANQFVRCEVSGIDIKSFANGLLMNFSNSIVAALCYIVLVVIGPLVIFLDFVPAILMLPFGLIFMTRVMISFLTKQNALINVFLHPIQMVCLFVFTLQAVGRRVLGAIKLKK